MPSSDTTDHPHPQQPGWSVTGDWSGQLVATAVHAGHDLRPEVAGEMVLDEEVRRREEDPATDRLGALLPARLVVHRSRFEIDLNRTRDEAVYRTPDDCWGLEVWRTDPLDEAVAEGSLEVYDAFYADLAEHLDVLAARGPFVLYDVHSYNHRGDSDDGSPAPAEDNPEVNVGTGSLDRDRWAPVVDAFEESLEATPGPELDVRENVKFVGRGLAQWVHARYPDTGCVLAIEFKKVYMDELTGEIDDAAVQVLAERLAATREPVLARLASLEPAPAGSTPVTTR